MRNSYSSSPFPGSFAPYAMSEAPWGPSARKPALYRLVRGITIVAVLSGVVVGLHRNDLLREGARGIGREAQYLELERQFLGAPGYGTPRSVEANWHAPTAPAASPPAAPVALAAPAAPAPEPTPEPANPVTEPAQPAAPPTPVAVAAAPAPEPAPVAKLEAPPPAALEPVDPLKPISLDQLPVLRSGQSSAKTVAASEAATPTSTPRAAAKVQVFDVDESKSKSKPSKPKVEKAAAAPKAPAKPKAKAPDPTAPRANDNPLKAAIRDAMRKQGVK